MTKTEVLTLIETTVNEIRSLNGFREIAINEDTALLDGKLEMDSLDLAGLVVVLESETDTDPFGNGFVDFRTAGELASLFSMKS